jgi:hypothetical protein
MVDLGMLPDPIIPKSTNRGMKGSVVAETQGHA